MLDKFFFEYIVKALPDYYLRMSSTSYLSPMFEITWINAAHPE